MAEIRAFQTSDRAEVEALMDDFGDELAAMDVRRRIVRRDGFGTFFVKEMEREAAENEGAVFVAARDEQVIGFAAGGVRLPNAGDELSVVPYRNGCITELYVSPEFRGRGVGTALVVAMERHFRSLECGAVRIEVFAPNEGARDFYARLNYEEREVDLFKPFA
jgi:ribosomal protein S18 acetylase RimI-like enzyme